MRLARQPGARPRLRWLDPELGRSLESGIPPRANVSPLRIRTKVGRTGVDFPRGGPSSPLGGHRRKGVNRGQGFQKFPHAW